MSFTCGIHGWRHLFKDCPACQETTVSNNATGIKKEELARAQAGIRPANNEDCLNLINDHRRISIENEKLKKAITNFLFTWECPACSMSEPSENVPCECDLISEHRNKAEKELHEIVQIR